MPKHRFFYLYKNHDIIPSREMAFFFYEQARKNQEEHLYFLAGLCLQFFDEKEKAFECFSLAANLGYDEALYQVAKALENGLGVEKSPKEAFSIYKRLYNHNFSEARKDVERCRQEGIGTKKLESKGLEVMNLEKDILY